MVIFWVCVAIGTVVYAIIIWSLVVYRKTTKQEASFHKSTAAEIAWTVIPLLLIIALTIPAAKVLTRLYNGESGESGAVEGLQKSEQIAMEIINYLPVIAEKSAAITDTTG